jgi:hypothetical protein
MSFEQTRQKADRLRAVPLESVLRLSGARPDRRDKNKWHTARGILSIQGAKFINWNLASGGGGAIDLVIHLHRGGFKAALEWPLPDSAGDYPEAHYPGRQLLGNDSLERKTSSPSPCWMAPFI